MYSPEVYDTALRILAETAEPDEEEPAPASKDGPIAVVQSETNASDAAMNNARPDLPQACIESPPLLIKKPASLKSQLLAPESKAWSKIAWLTVKRNIQKIIADNAPPVSAGLSLVESKTIDCGSEIDHGEIELFYKPNSTVIDGIILPVHLDNDKFIDWAKTGLDLDKVLLCTQKLAWLQRWKAGAPEREIYVELPPAGARPDFLAWLEDNNISGRQDAVILLGSRRKQIAAVIASLSSDKMLYMIESSPGGQNWPGGKDNFSASALWERGRGRFVCSKASELPSALTNLDAHIMWPHIKDE